MRTAHSFCLEVRDEEGRWSMAVFDHGLYSRDPAAIARSVVEQWIIGHPRELQGGERVTIVRARDEPTAERVSALDAQASVRVQVYAGNLLRHARRPEAVAYLGFDDPVLGAERRSPVRAAFHLPRQRRVLSLLRRRLSA